LLWLALGTALMALVMAILLALQLTQNQSIRQNNEGRTDSVSTLAFQFEREFLRFREALERTIYHASPSEMDDLALRFDILISRRHVLQDNPSTTQLTQNAAYTEAVPRLDALIQRTEVEMGRTPVRQSALVGLLTAYNDLGPDIQALTLAADSLVAHQVEDQKIALLSQNQRILWLILAQLALLLAAAGALALRHKRQELERVALEKLTQDLREANVAAQSASRSKSQFLANMSHELRTPFNGVLGMLGLLETTPLNPTQADYVKTVRESANHLLVLLNDILDVSALEAGKMSINAGPVCMPDLLHDVQALMGPLAADKGLGFSIIEQAGIPPWVEVDNTRLRQILFNLINNGIKFTKQGGVRLTVGGQTRAGGIVDLSFEIHDTGIGMDQAGLSRLFERFYQVDMGVARQFGGTGLGLEISQSLARMMGGEIKVQSQLGQGSVFTVYLPLPLCDAPEPVVRPQAPVAAPSPTLPPAKAQASTAPVPAPAPSTPADEPPAPRVLVVEDHVVNQKYVRVLLSRMGCEAVVCDNGQLALNVLQNESFDLVLMDINMPVMDGRAATRAIRTMPGKIAKVPIIVMTADLMNDARELALEAGATAFLTKPVQIAEFKSVVGSYLGKPATA
jgi:two-component system, sensor histidine kinase